MKRLLLVILIAILLSGSILPPALPSSFWGTIDNYPGGRVCVYANGTQQVCSTPFLYKGGWVYALNVPMDGTQDGTIARFYIRGVLFGKTTLRTGTNANLNLKSQLRR